MATSKIYQLPVLYPPLQPAESVYQAVEVIAQLNAIVDEVFGKIRAKVEREKARLDAIGSRIQAANDKTSEIKMRKISAVVSSPPVYPAPFNIPSNIPAIIPTEIKEFPKFPQKPQFHLKSRKIPEPQLSVEDLSDFSVTSQNSYSKTSTVYHEIRSVDSLVQFDKKEKRPKSIQPPIESVSPFGDNHKIPSEFTPINYFPGFGENFPSASTLPEMLNIPGVNVALDIEYKKGETQPIAPALLDLPEINSPVSPPQPPVSPPQPPVSPPQPPVSPPQPPVSPPQPPVSPQSPASPPQPPLSPPRQPVSPPQPPVSPRPPVSPQPPASPPQPPVSPPQPSILPGSRPPITPHQPPIQPVSRPPQPPVSQPTIPPSQPRQPPVPPPLPPKPKVFQPPKPKAFQPPNTKKSKIKEENPSPPSDTNPLLSTEIQKRIDVMRRDIEGPQDSDSNLSEWED